ncbi:kinesin light chain [Colletotrichum truncatum]|uniref:Kinesin light chain n=1 Tax=Colletotrichum truncatum TaxID=5467 RepID=A0ACC3YHF7_COLTU|nr:kinesin light chain [Colletotrichum truncatum]KAF6792875.1 kinesin light chain [Colletotrichum truncatum]
MASQARRRRHEDFQIAVICALPLEYDAVVFACDEIWEEDKEQLSNASGDYNTYSTGRVGPHNVVLLLLPGMGKTNAAGAAASLRSTYPGIKLAILAGICGGVPGVGTNNEVYLGDVVISKSIMQYDLGRKYPNQFNSKDTVEDRLGRPNKEIRSLVAALETLHGRSSLQRRASQVMEQIRQRAVDEGHQSLYKRPIATEDRLFEPEYLHRHRDGHSCECSESKACEKALTTSCDVLQCDYSRLVVRSLPDVQTLQLQGQTDDSMVARQVRILVGRMGSGDTVMKSGLDRDRIAEEHDLIAFEMEGAGVWDEIPCIIVKAVCDYADSHKNKKWQHFAAATAASTTKALLERYSHMDSLSTSQTWFLVPYIENPDFIGRSQTLDQIKRLFGHEQQFDQSPKPRSRVALYGLGGIGKTQIALAYALWLQRDHPDVSVFWVHASNADRFRQGYIAIAQECNIPGRDNSEADVLMLVKTWLEKGIRGRWLMVIDNADDTQLFFPSSSPDGSTNTHSTTEKPGGLGRYIPECAHGSILITTRNKQAALRIARSNPLLKIEGMSDNETNQLLNTMLDDEVHTDEASDLSKRLEHLPLALAQAAAFIQENTISISQYLQLLEESDESLVNQLSEPFEAVGRDSETPHALTSTWIVSFNQIQQQEALASDVLSFASLLDRQGIPEEFIVHFCNQRDTDEQQMSTSKVTKAVGVLKAFSFVSQAKDNAITMHRLVQLVTRKWLETQKRLASYAEQALDIVSNLYPFGKHENRQVCQEYLPHANAVLQNKGTDSRDERLAKALLLHNVGAYFRYRGQWKQAELSATQSTGLWGEILGDQHLHTVAGMTELATTYRDQGRWKEAEELDVQVLETKRRVLGDEHPNTLRSIANLASTYWDQGRWKEAEELEVQVLETRRRVLGDEHPNTLVSISNLVSTYQDQGRWKEAEELHVQVLETKRRVLGDEHPNTLVSISNLASTYWNQGRWKEAEELEVQVLETRRRVLGDEHPDTLFSIGNLASTYWNQGRWKEAEELEVQVLETKRRVFGDEHPDTLRSIGNLASTYWDQGRWDEAEELEVQVLETERRVLGDEHPDTLISMANLAHTWKSQGRQVDAIQLMRECLGIRQRGLGVDHPDTISSLSNLKKWEKDLIQVYKMAVGKKRLMFKVPMRNRRVRFKHDIFPR